MKTILWIYAVTGSLYLLMYAAGSEVVVRFAIGPLWAAMMAAPVVLCLLLLSPLARRLGLFDE